MNWRVSHRFSPAGRRLADRHYSRQTPGSPQFAPPGRCLVLLGDGLAALWVTSWPQYASHAWAGAWVCSLFRNESAMLSSSLIRQAVAATRWKWPDVPAAGIVTFVDVGKVRPKRDPGRCFLLAGFVRVEMTAGGLVALAMPPGAMPAPATPVGWQLSLEDA